MFKTKLINHRKETKESLVGPDEPQGDEESPHFKSRRRRLKVNMLRRYKTLDRFDSLAHNFKLKIENEDEKLNDGEFE